MTLSSSTGRALPWPLRLARRWLPVLILLTLLGGFLGAVRLGLSLGEPFAGFVLLWRKEFKLLTVSWVTPPNWSGPAAGMHINDRILCIDGYMPSPDSLVYGLDPRYAEHPCPKGGKNFAAIFRDAYHTANPAIDYFIDRNGTLMTVSNVPVVRFTPGLMLETFTPVFLLGLALLGLGWVVYRANPEIEINLIFSLVMLVCSNFAFNNSLAGLITDRQFETGRLTLVQLIPWLALLGPLIFHLVDLLSGPVPLFTTSRILRRPYYLLAGVFSTLGTMAFIFNDSQISQPITWAYLIWIGSSWIFSALWALASLSLAYRQAAQRRVRMQTGLSLAALVLSALFCIPFTGLYFINPLTFPYMQGLPYLGLVVVGVMAYAILRYQLFTARTQTLTFLLVLVASVLTALIVYLPVGSEIGFIPLLGASLLASSVFAGRFKPLNFLDRLLHREEQDYQTAARFSQHIRQPQSPGWLAEAASRALKDELEAEQIDLWLFCPEQPNLEHFVAGHPVAAIPLAATLARLVAQAAGPVYAHSPAGQAFTNSLSSHHTAHPSGLWAPLADRDQAIGLLYIGRRWTGEVYSEDDLRLVRLLSVQLGLAIANSRQVERLQSMQRLILQAEENERYKIARELHDTVLQFLLVLTFGLDTIKENPSQSSQRIEDWQGRISAEAGRLRDLLSYLRTPETLEQRGLLASLEMLFSALQQQTNIRLTWRFEPQVEPALAVDNKVAIYRVLREAVHNAIKHAHARQVTIQLTVKDSRVSFSVHDDGLGFEITSARQTSTKGYSSIQDMGIYIESTGGKLEIQSTPGKGTLIQGWAPALPCG